MPTIALLNQSGEKINDLVLSEEVFGIEPNQQVIYDVVNAQRAGMRQGTHKVKTRSEVRGGGRKPWNQKGSGRARQGSTRSPQCRHGGVAFGPTPRSYAVKVNRKVVKVALKSALSYKAKNNKLVAVDNISFDSIKTKNFVEFLNNVKVEGKTIVLVKELTKEVSASAANIPNVFVCPVDHASVYNILCYDKLVVTSDVVSHYEEVLK